MAEIFSDTFVLKEVIDDLVNPDKSLTGPLMKLQYFARRIKNEQLLDFTTKEIEGYKFHSDTVPEYRKVYADLEVTLQAGYHKHIEKIPSILLEKPFDVHLRTLSITEGIGTLTQMMQDTEGAEKGGRFIAKSIPAEMLHIIQPAVDKYIHSDTYVTVTSARVVGNGYIVSEILNTVRARLLKFTMEVGEEFGYNIDINSFKQHQEANNKTIINIMNTEINNSGDANVVNTGSHSTINATITVTKGNWEQLKKTLADKGVSNEDLTELYEIIESEQPDFENKKLGSKAIDWITKVSAKALHLGGIAATHLSSAMLAEAIMHYFGMK